MGPGRSATNCLTGLGDILGTGSSRWMVLISSIYLVVAAEALGELEVVEDSPIQGTGAGSLLADVGDVTHGSKQAVGGDTCGRHPVLDRVRHEVQVGSHLHGGSCQHLGGLLRHVTHLVAHHVHGVARLVGEELFGCVCHLQSRIKIKDSIIMLKPHLVYVMGGRYWLVIHGF